MQWNKLVPEFSVSNIEKSLAFYINLLNFEIVFQRPENKFAYLAYQGSQIMVEQYNGNWQTGEFEYPLGRGINFSIESDEVEQIVKRLQASNYPIMLMPEESWYRENNTLHGEIHFLVQDPDGYLLRFAQYSGEREVENV
jgi:catechol 2,3-dioxygenase-like lactoylglutathione lyase family enzyme